MSAKSRGAYSERLARDELKSRGYFVTKAAGSLGLFDLVAVGQKDVRLVQVKTNRAPGTKEMAAIRAFSSEAMFGHQVHVEVWIHVRRKGWTVIPVSSLPAAEPAMVCGAAREGASAREVPDSAVISSAEPV